MLTSVIAPTVVGEFNSISRIGVVLPLKSSVDAAVPSTIWELSAFPLIHGPSFSGPAQT